MDKRSMGIILIIAGAIILVCGIVMISTDHNKVEEPAKTQPQVVVVEKHIHHTETTPPVAEKAAEPAKTQPQVVVVEKHIHDTIITPVVVEKKEPAPVEPVKPTVNESKAKGDAFEDFVVNLLADWRLKLLDRTQDAVSTAGVAAESCKNPDLHVQQKRGKGEIDYYVECKYRSQWKDGAVTFDDWQLNRYRKFQRDNRRKVILAIGVGGTPTSPATFMLVPLDSVKGNTIKQISTEFAVEPSPSALVEYMNNYFSKVFSKAKQNS